MLANQTDSAISKASKLIKKGELEEAKNIYNNLLKKFPNNIRAQKGLFQLSKKNTTEYKSKLPHQKLYELLNLYNTHKFIESLEYGNELIKNFLCGSDVYWIMALSSSSLQSFTETKYYLEKAVQIDPKHIESLFQLGVLFQNNSNPQLSINYYKRVLLLNTNHFYAHFNLATCLGLCNQKQDAIIEFEKCINLNPNYFDIYINIGIIYLDMDNIEIAQYNFKKALELNQNSSIALNNYGVSLFKNNQFDEAITYYQKALIIDPHYSEAYLNFGSALKDLGDLDQSITMTEKAIKINPNLVEAYNNLAGILNLKGEYQKAIELCKKSIEIDENRVEAFCNISVSYEYLGEYAKVLDICNKAIKIDPGNISIIVAWGRSLFKLGRKTESIQKLSEILEVDQYNLLANVNIIEVLNSQKKYKKSELILEKLIEYFPKSSEVLASMANTKSYLKDYEKAIYFYDESLKSNNQNYNILNCQGLCYAQMGDFKNAEEVLYNSLNINESDIAYNNLGYLFSKQNNFEKAEYFFKKAININYNYPDPQLNLALLLLLKNNYNEGLKKYEWRLKNNTNSLFTYEFDTTYKRWSKGIPLEGKVLLIHAEQGLGDTIQFARFIDLFVGKNTSIVFKVQDCLVELLFNMNKDIKVISNKEKFNDFDYQIPLISLLIEMSFDPKQYVYKPNYLKLENQKRIEKWKPYLQKDHFLIGVSWQASQNSIGKSFEIEHLREIAEINGVRLISLQKNFGIEQLNKSLDFSIEDLGDDFDNGSQAFLDTAAVLKSLDLVITCDTALVHLSGALEINTFCPLKKYPDWRWGLTGENTFWYNTVKLFRQDNDGDWGKVFKKVKKETLKLMQ